ncbi:MAG: hypothetical protein JO276_14430 [Sphingomonadaceae bacterium]|nr:hypothetical protein [Sphingomonadaceae bacterium]
MKPGDFYVGVIDFFSILLPGALLAGTVMMVRPITGPMPPLLSSETAQWVTFALAAYAIGHFAHLISSILDPLYDLYRPVRWRDCNHDLGPFQSATTLRRKHFRNKAPVKEGRPMNTFKWAQSVLMLRAPAALADVNRYEAHSKFFRSMAIVLPVAGGAVDRFTNWQAFPAALAFAVVSFVIYASLRFKSTEWAYRYVLVLNRLGELERRRSETKDDDRSEAKSE